MIRRRIRRGSTVKEHKSEVTTPTVSSSPAKMPRLANEVKATTAANAPHPPVSTGSAVAIVTTPLPAVLPTLPLLPLVPQTPFKHREAYVNSLNQKEPEIKIQLKMVSDEPTMTEVIRKPEVPPALATPSVPMTPSSPPTIIAPDPVEDVGNELIVESTPQLVVDHEEEVVELCEEIIPLDTPPTVPAPKPTPIPMPTTIMPVVRLAQPPLPTTAPQVVKVVLPAASLTPLVGRLSAVVLTPPLPPMPLPPPPPPPPPPTGTVATAALNRSASIQKTTASTNTTYKTFNLPSHKIILAGSRAAAKTTSVTPVDLLGSIMASMDNKPSIISSSSSSSSSANATAPALASVNNNSSNSSATNTSLSSYANSNNSY